MEEVLVPLLYRPDEVLSLRQAGMVLGRSPMIVSNWLKAGRIVSLRYSDIMEFKAIWEKEGKSKAYFKDWQNPKAAVGRPKGGVGLTAKVVDKIMELALELEDGYGVELFKKRMAIMFNTTSVEVGKILESRVFIRRRVNDDFAFSRSNDDTAILKILKQLILNPDTKDKTRLAETINEIVKQKGTGKKWKLKEVGDKVDDKLKTYELEEK